MSTNALVTRDDAAGENELIQLVSFMLANEEYGVEVLKVREIIRLPTITKMPNMPPHMEGIINLRGKVIPIISMRKRFGLYDSDSSDRNRIIIMDVAGGLTGFIVDAVSEVIRIQGSDINQPPPAVISGGVGQEFITGVLNHGERLLIIMDVNRMFSEEEREDFARMA
ncbi:chemotaxis protein CheW [Geobacter sp. SVR]|uniref:chemotaxis protein CheW n=1 Tax=Geobacter sp. SVR TaxID=2495594 RepID=UPI00143EF99A|nr:chemotaxis protein CheW [Geobacter sp. SVR]BCS54627.1 chemotaxis protein CheW [Geobacter sp. SVR]GCF86865.1 chemotaxis protein CheW [Geobacter sp. SVR]